MLTRYTQRCSENERMLTDEARYQTGTGWAVRSYGSLELTHASTIEAVGDCYAAFTRRSGGVSTGPFTSLNTSLTVGDEPQNVEANRLIAIEALAGSGAAYVSAQQTHSDHIAIVHDCSTNLLTDTDALVTNQAGVAIMLTFADCTPVFAYDPVNRVVGIAHSGWRGTALAMSAKMIALMSKEFGSEPSKVIAAIGPCICGEHYQTGCDVADAMEPWLTSVSDEPPPV